MLSSHIILKTFDLVIHQNPPTLHQTWLLNHCLGLLKKLSGFAGFAFYNTEFWHKNGKKLSFLIHHDWKFQPHETIYQNGWNQDDIEIGQKLDKIGQKWQGSEVTVFENHSKCRIFNFHILAFSSNFSLLKVTCLVTLFDCSLRFSKTL